MLLASLSLSLSGVSAVHFHQRTVVMRKGSSSFFQFSRQRVCLWLTSFSVQGHSESNFLQKLKLLLFGLHFLPLQMSFLFTFAGQSVSLLVLPFWLHPAVWVLWHYLLPDRRGLPDCPRLSSFPCQEVC